MLDRRKFLRGALAGAGALALGGATQAAEALDDAVPALGDAAATPLVRPPYRGPNVVVVRFGGGVRRRETILPRGTHCPYLLHELVGRGTFFPKMAIAPIEGVQTSHGQGTLNILTGKYDGYEDVNQRFLGERFEAKVPTLFEYLRKSFDIPTHETLIVNGEDRIDEEFYTFSNHHLFGVRFKSDVLSLYRFKTYLLHKRIAAGEWKDEALELKRAELAEMERLDHRVEERSGQAPEIESFWERWEGYYGRTGLVNPRGDSVLTELAVRAIRELRPRLMMVNYNDCDYVHWGYMSHYTRAIQIMDEGLRRLVETTESDEAYRDNTVFVVVPDCGRDSNPFVAVPCQHHFNSPSAHEIFALVFGTGVPRGQVVDKSVDQIRVAATVAGLMGFPAEFAEGETLEEAIL